MVIISLSIKLLATKIPDIEIAFPADQAENTVQSEKTNLAPKVKR